MTQKNETGYKKLHRVTPGCLRHLFATDIYKKSNYNSLIVSEALGHKDKDVAPQYYIGVDCDKVENCIRSLENEKTRFNRWNIALSWL